jgi:26S proteasome regulatory subunit N13
LLTYHPTELSLTDVLTPGVLLPLFQTHPELIPALFPSLPPDLPNPPSAATLERVVTSAQFRAQVRSFDRALRTGMLGDLVRGLGLPEEAGTGVEPFLRAIAEQARARGDERMETD